MNAIEMSADIKFYNFKTREVHTEKSLVTFDRTTGKMVAAGNECEDYVRFPQKDELITISPLVLGQITDFMAAERMLKTLRDRHLGKLSFFSKRRGFLFLHEDVDAGENNVQKKVYMDVMYMLGYLHFDMLDAAGGYRYFDSDEQHYDVKKAAPMERKAEDMPWEEYLMGMDKQIKGLHGVIEITKQNMAEYARCSMEQLLKDCERWGVGRDELKQWI